MVEPDDRPEHPRQLSRRDVLRAGLALPALAVPFVAGCGGGRQEPRREPSTSRRPAATPTSGTVGSTTTPEAQRPEARGPLGSGEPVTFAFAGDTHFVDWWDTEGGANYAGVPVLAAQLMADPMHVLAPIAPVLSGADLAMVNLETAITQRGTPVAGKAYHFRSPAESFVALKAAGVDVINMANNHALDYGPVGMEDTFAAIAASGVPVVGIGHDAAEAFRPSGPSFTASASPSSDRWTGSSRA